MSFRETELNCRDNKSYQFKNGKRKSVHKVWDKDYRRKGEFIGFVPRNIRPESRKKRGGPVLSRGRVTFGDSAEGGLSKGVSHNR